MSMKIKSASWIFGYLMVPTVLVAAEPLALPEVVQSKIGEILEIKKEAMKLRSMRSEDGILGKRCETLMNELGEIIIDPSLIHEIENNEGKDIRIKIALWAVDRKKRSQEYERFAKYYVNEPSMEEAPEYFSRPLAKQNPPDPFAEPGEPKPYTPRPGAWSPNPVDEEDQIEENRLILECHYFIPPTGKAFDDDDFRHKLSSALLGLKNHQKSIVVMAVDAEMALSEKGKHDKNKREPYNEHAPLRFMAMAPSDQSFIYLSKAWKDESVHQTLQSIFNRIWYDLYMSEYQDVKKIYDTWQAIAEKSWDTPEQQEFAEWLRSFDPPKDPSATE